MAANPEAKRREVEDYAGPQPETSATEAAVLAALEALVKPQVSLPGSLVPIPSPLEIADVLGVTPEIVDDYRRYRTTALREHPFASAGGAASTALVPAAGLARPIRHLTGGRMAARGERTIEESGRRLSEIMAKYGKRSSGDARENVIGTVVARPKAGRRSEAASRAPREAAEAVFTAPSRKAFPGEHAAHSGARTGFQDLSTGRRLQEGDLPPEYLELIKGMIARQMETAPFPRPPE